VQDDDNKNTCRLGLKRAISENKAVAVEFFLYLDMGIGCYAALDALRSGRS